jgi:maleylacetoacetate isomerase
MMTLHGYWRSSASYRVRIALAMKGVEVEHKFVNLKTGEQLEPGHSALNAQPYVPVLELEDGTKLTQSLAIMDYLDATFPDPELMPRDAILRSKILSASLIIASDIAPIANLSVLKYLRAEYGQGDEGVKAWIHHWIEKGFTALEIIAEGYDTPFLMTDAPAFFECCLIPQVYNANRFGVDITQFPKLSAINAACLTLPAFQKALPENQADATI